MKRLLPFPSIVLAGRMVRKDGDESA